MIRETPLFWRLLSYVLVALFCSMPLYAWQSSRGGVPDLTMLDALVFCEDISPAVQGNIRNIGDGDTGPFTIGYYLSEDPIITTDDVLLDQEPVGGLSPNRTYKFQRFFGSEIAVGTWYIGVIADYDDQVLELSEGNNAINGGLIDLPCLPPSDVTLANSTVRCGNGEVVVNTDVSNFGEGEAGPFWISLRYSETAPVTLDDPQLSRFRVFGLVPGQTSKIQFVGETPFVEAGNYHFGLFADSNSDLVESNEENNSDQADGTLTLPCVGDAPELTIPFLNFRCLDNGLLEVLGTVRNVGTQNAGPFQIGIYASSDDAITTTDNRFLSFNVPDGLEPGEDFNFNVELDEISVGNASWFVGAIADDTNQVAEWHETNNDQVFGNLLLPCDRPSPDLIPTSFDAWCVAPGLMEIEGIIENQGVRSSPNFTVTIYLSENDIITNLDQPVDSFVLTGMDVDRDRDFNRLVDVSGLVKGDNFYVGVLVDPNDAIEEVDDTNNNLTGPIVDFPCEEQDIDLRPISFQYQCDSTRDVRLFGTIENGGEDYARPFLIGYYRSNDAVITRDDVLIGIDDVAAGLEGMSTRDFSRIFDLRNLPDDSYHFGIIIDYEDDVIETLEGNNITRRGPVFIPCEAELQIVPSELVFDYRIPGNTPFRNDDFILANQGTETVVGEIDFDAPWIESVSPRQFAVPPQSQLSVRVRVDRDQAPVGTNVTQLEINSNAAQDTILFDVTLINPQQAAAGIGAGSGVVGDTVRVPLTLAELDASPITSFQTEFTFDDTLLRFDDISSVGTLSSGWTITVNDATPGRVLIGGIDADALAGDGVLMNLDFQIQAGGAGQCVPVMLDSMVLGDGSADVTLMDGEICVAECTQGDLDGDGSITAFDASLALNMALGIPTAFDPIPISCADADCDGVITAFDASLILRVAQGIETDFCTRVMPRGAGIAVTYPEYLGREGDLFNLPISTEDLDLGTDVTAWQFRLTYDPNAITFTDFSTTGATSDGQTVAVNTAEPGLLVAGGFGANPMSGSGLLLDLDVTSVGPGLFAPAWSQFLFNAGDPVSDAVSAEIRLLPDLLFEQMASWTGGTMLQLVNLINDPSAGGSGDNNP